MVKVTIKKIKKSPESWFLDKPGREAVGLVSMQKDNGLLFHRVLVDGALWRHYDRKHGFYEKEAQTKMLSGVFEEMEIGEFREIQVDDFSSL